MNNKVKKTNLKSSIKNVEMAIEATDKVKATELLSVASKKLDSAVTSGIVHKNYTARQKSRLSKQINAL